MENNQVATTQTTTQTTTKEPEKKRPTRRRTYSERINEVKLLVAAGLKNIAQLTPGGFNMDYIDQLIAQREKVEEINADQEKRKADLKSATEFLYTELRELDDLVRDARKIVKMRVSVSRWKAFGIKVTR